MSARLQQETLQYLVRAMEQKHRELNTTLGRFRRDRLEGELKILSDRFKVECGVMTPELSVAA